MKVRYSLSPQMRDYDKAGQIWSPYLMFFHAPNFFSTSLNTDNNGFRISYKNSQLINSFNNINADQVGLIVGGSYAFGVGATSDKNSLTSLMNASTDFTWLNFGGRAYSSTQELLLFQFFHQQISNIKKIVIISGVNNLVLQYMSNNDSELGAFFFQNQFQTQMNSIMSKKRNLAKILLSPFFGDTIDYARIPYDELKKILLLRKRPEHPNMSTSRIEDKENILRVMVRDLINWKLLTKALGIELHYVLQPYANWIDKEKSEEEAQLFTELDQFQGVDWKILKEKIDKGLYCWYTTELKEICRLNQINYLDMNEQLSNLKLDRQWLFVDRIHFNDEGNRIAAKILKEKVLNLRKWD